MSMDKSRRLRVLEISGQLLVHFVMRPEDRRLITSQGLPADAQFVTAYYDQERGSLRVLVASREFDLVPEGEHPCLIVVTFTVTQPEWEA